MAETIIDLKAVNKWFDDFHVLVDINLRVEKGERIVICGPSGSGKSTLIRCLNRLEEHQTGTIKVDGIELTSDLRNIEKIRRLNRSSLLPIAIGSVAVAIAQLFRYLAFEYSPISLVAPIAGTSPLFVLPLSFIINRSIETFGIRIIIGTFAAVIGVFLIFWVV